MACDRRTTYGGGLPLLFGAFTMQTKRNPDTSGLPRITGARARDIWRHAFSQWRRCGRNGADIAGYVSAARLLRLLGCQWGLPLRNPGDQCTPIWRGGRRVVLQWHGPTRAGREFFRRTR